MPTPAEWALEYGSLSSRQPAPLRKSASGTLISASGSKWQVSTDSGAFTIWRSDSKELLYVKLGGIAAVEVKPGSSFEAGVRKLLFDLAGRARGDPVFAVTADGQRFLIVGQTQDTANLQYTVVVNWIAELKK